MGSTGVVRVLMRIVTYLSSGGKIGDKISAVSPSLSISSGAGSADQILGGHL